MNDLWLNEASHPTIIATLSDIHHPNLNNMVSDDIATNSHALMLQQLIRRVQVHSLESTSHIQPKTFSKFAKASLFSQPNQLDEGIHQVSTQTLLNTLINTPIADASVLVAITNEQQPQLLLTRRASHIKAHAGEVAFAGGKYETGDGNNVITALRESYEEIALNPKRVKIIGQLPIQWSKSGLSVRPIVALIEPNPQLKAEKGEIAHIFWADLANLITQPTVDHHVSRNIAGRTLNLSTPSWQIDGEIVWGLTGRIIASLFDIAYDRQIDWYYRPNNLPYPLSRVFSLMMKTQARMKHHRRLKMKN